MYSMYSLYTMHRTQKISPNLAIYNQLLYPLIFFDGTGGIGKLPEDKH